MLPLKKSMTSKSVILLLMFLTSTSFGFLENANRVNDYRRDLRRVSMDRKFREELPFRKDINRRANEKDIIYENLYDRRSFRTGTDRHIENHERTSNILGRNFKQRSVFFNRDNRIRDHLSDNLRQQERSRYFNQNDRVTRLDRVTNDDRSRVGINTRNFAQRSERNVRALDERNSRKISFRENNERLLENKPSFDLRPTRTITNRNDFASRRNRDLDRNIRKIPFRSFRDEQRLKLRYQNHEEDALRRSISRSSRDVEEQRVRTSVNRERSFERRSRNNERLVRSREQLTRGMENRQCDLDRQSRLIEDTRETRTQERLPTTIQREFRSTVPNERERSFRQYRYVQNNDRTSNNRLQESDRRVSRNDHNRNGIVFNSQNRIQNLQRTVLNRNRFRNDFHRAVSSRRDSTRRMLDARINSQPIRNGQYNSVSSGQEISSYSNRRIVDRQLPVVTNTRRVAELESVKSIDRRIAPVAEYQPNIGKSFGRIADVRQSETWVHKFKFDGVADVIQIILGVYLVGQIFAHSSKKKSFGFRNILPTMNCIKYKWE